MHLQQALEAFPVVAMRTHATNTHLPIMVRASGYAVTTTGDCYTEYKLSR
jgi:hypothetical protein